MEQVEQTFKSLTKTLSRAVPLVSGVTVLLVIGAENITIQSIVVPIKYTPIITVLLLIWYYLHCYRSASVLQRVINKRYVSYDHGEDFFETDKAAIFLRNYDSSFNPFLSTTGKYEPRDVISDYPGIFLIIIFPLAALVAFEIVWINQFSFEMERIIKVGLLLKMGGGDPGVWFFVKSYLLEMFYHSPYLLAEGILLILVGLFVFKIGLIMLLVNPEDFAYRAVCLGGLAIVYAILMLIIPIIIQVMGFIDLFSDWDQCLSDLKPRVNQQAPPGGWSPLASCKSFFQLGPEGP